MSFCSNRPEYVPKPRYHFKCRHDRADKYSADTPVYTRTTDVLVWHFFLLEYKTATKQDLLFCLKQTPINKRLETSFFLNLAIQSTKR
jgi:hypothetical protein